MSKYLNVFNTLAEYQAFSASTEYVQPNVALVKETNVLYYDYGDNKPQVDMSDFKLETEEISVGGDKYGIDAITKINYIPLGITSLKSAFMGFRSLVNAPVIPDSVTNMSYTFYGCSSLKEVTFLITTPLSYNRALDSCSKLETIYVPDSAVDTYKNATGWSQFADKFKPLSSKPTE